MSFQGTQKEEQREIYSLDLTPSSLNLTSFKALFWGFHSSNWPMSSVISVNNSLLTYSSSSKPLIAKGKMYGFGEEDEGPAAWVVLVPLLVLVEDGVMVDDDDDGERAPGPDEGLFIYNGTGPRDDVSREYSTARWYTDSSS